jgi:amino acid transporter
VAHEGKLRKEAGLIGLLYASVGGIVGSGWLFGPLHAAQQAGPLSIWSWVIGAAAIMLLALVFSELATLIPKSGALVHISHVSHGASLGLIWSWILFFAYVTVAPVEVMAVLTYANNYIPGLIQPDSGLLTHTGFITSVVFLGFFVVLNFLVIRWVLFINSAATWWKLAVPAATVFVLIGFSFHPQNLHLVRSPSDTQVGGMFTAVATSGVIFSYFGFRQAIDLAGETANPSRNIPIAVIGSVMIGLVLYVGLQLAFLLAVSPEELAKGGWAGLHFTGLTGPFAAIAAVVGATWWAVVLYIDAIVSPAGTAFIYVTAASRITMATGEIGSGPAVLGRINNTGVPWVALLVTYVAGALFFFPFPSWQKLVSYISSVTVLSYSIGHPPAVPSVDAVAAGARGVHRVQLDHLLDRPGNPQLHVRVAGGAVGVLSGLPLRRQARCGTTDGVGAHLVAVSVFRRPVAADLPGARGRGRQRCHDPVRRHGCRGRVQPCHPGHRPGHGHAPRRDPAIRGRNDRTPRRHITLDRAPHRCAMRLRRVRRTHRIRDCLATPPFEWGKVRASGGTNPWCARRTLH